MNKIKLILVGTVLLSTVSFAQTTSPFQLLQKQYDESTLPAALEDFDLQSNTTSNQHCVAAEATSTAPYDLVVMRIYGVMEAGTPAIPGIPSQGPLFPGTPGTPATPDKMGTYLTYTTGTDRTAVESTLSLTEKDVVTFTATDLIDAYSDSANPDSASTIMVRKSGNLLVFRGIEDPSSSTPTVVYGYCYRQ